MRHFVTAATTLLLFAVVVRAEDKPAKAQKNQMVNGTIKEVNVKNKVLVVNQKLKQQTVERQLDIKGDTEIIITKDGKKEVFLGLDGLEKLEGKEGTMVKVKCDKDVNVLSVTVTLKK